MIAEEKEQELKRARHEGQMETEKVDKHLCTSFFVHLLTYIFPHSKFTSSCVDTRVHYVKSAFTHCD